MNRTLQQVSSAAIILTSRRRLLLAPCPPGFNGGSSNQTRIISLTLPCELPEVEDEEYLRAARCSGNSTATDLQTAEARGHPPEPNRGLAIQRPTGHAHPDRRGLLAFQRPSGQVGHPRRRLAFQRPSGHAYPDPLACWLSSAPQGRYVTDDSATAERQTWSHMAA